MPNEMALPEQAPEMFLQRVARCAGDADHITHRHTAMLPGMVDDLDGQLRQGRHHQPLALNLVGQTALLLLKGTEEELQPGLPIRRIAADTALGLPQRQIVALFVVLDDALER